MRSYLVPLQGHTPNLGVQAVHDESGSRRLGGLRWKAMSRAMTYEGRPHTGPILVTNQTAQSGIGVYSHELFRLLRDSIPELSLYSLSYRSSLPSPDARRPAGARTGSGILSSARAASVNSRLFQSEVDLEATDLHLCGVDYGLAARAHRAIATIHDYYFRPLDLRDPRRLHGILTDLASNVINLRTAVQLESCRQLIVPSLHAQKQLRETLGLSSRVIYPWIDETRFRPREKLATRKQLGLPLDAYVLVTTGGDTWNKNLPTLERIRKDLPAGHLLVKIGAPLSSSPKVYNAGVPDFDRYPEFLSAADCYIHPSLEEGFGIPLIEALGSGVPVVAADRATSREVLGDAALYVNDANDAGSYLSAIGALTDPLTRERLRSAGQERMRQFARTEALAAYQDVYDRAFGRQGN